MSSSDIVVGDGKQSKNLVFGLHFTCAWITLHLRMPIRINVIRGSLRSKNQYITCLVETLKQE